MTAGIILAIVLAVCAVLFYARKGGQDSVKADIGDQNAKTAAKVADAVAAAPRNDAELSERLLDPSRPL